jgi:hypothetical protein
MKTFISLPVMRSGIGASSLLRHIGGVVLFSILGYCLTAMTFGAIAGDVWKYFQSIERFYITQAIIMLVVIVIGIIFKAFANMLMFTFFYHYPKIDKYLYPIGFVLGWLIINEI